MGTRFFEPILDLWQVLKFCRFAVLTIIVAAYLLIWNPQGQEVLIRLQDDGGLSGNLLFLCAVILWAWVLWYSCRVILNFQFAQWPPLNVREERKERILWLHQWMPRVLGGISFLVIAYAIFESGHDFKTQGSRLGLSILYIACAGLFTFIVWKRHEWSNHLRQRYSMARKILPEPPHDQPLFLTSFHQLPKPRKWGVWIFLIGLFLIPFLLFQTRDLNLTVAPLLMSPTILILAAASWVPVGSLLVYGSGHYRIPIFTILFLYLVLISPLNDNHQVRTVPIVLEHQSDVAEKFEQWKKDNWTGTENEPKLPVILVAAEGGGVRAAYWTASVLARIQREREDFASHIFVISSVSGGSLGAGLFAALIADEGSGGHCSKRQNFLNCARRMLKRDFLAPTFATMLYPDLLQRFLFWPVPNWDRARTLEISWEQAWMSVTGSPANRFEQPFENLWSDGKFSKLPNLILNMTSVEHGNRVLMSNLQLQNDAELVCLEAFNGRARGIFDDVINFKEAINAYPCNREDTGSSPATARTVRLSTAINNSARFSFISPAGTVNPRLHIVDGGYFENSGTTTLEEVYQEIKPKLSEKLVPVILYISNEPQDKFRIGVLYKGPLDSIVEHAPKKCIRVEIQAEMVRELPKRASACPPGPPTKPSEVILLVDKSLAESFQVGQFYTLHLDKNNKVIQVDEPKILPLHEVATPFYAIFRTRLARGSHAVQHLRRQVPQYPSGRFIHFQLKKGGVDLPLGWTLSKEATKEIDTQLEKAFQNCQNKKLGLLEYIDNCWPNKTEDA